jgi:hypothetical protein
MANPLRESDMEDVTSLSGTLTVFDSNGNPVAGASISEVPEVSSLALLLSVFGLMLLRRIRRARES